MERRHFIKSSCNLCLLGASGVLLSQLGGCSPAAFNVTKTDIVDHKIQLPLAAFAKGDLQLVRPNGWYYDIAVQKKEAGKFTALLLQCTHQENQLTTTGNGYSCSLHGSLFDKEGNVKKGPATDPLESYKTFIQNNNLVIEIPKI